VSKAKPPKPLPKKLVFAAEFLKDRNATQAAIRAGYSPRTAHSSGPRLLTDVEVATFIKLHTDKVVESIAEESRTTVSNVLREVERIAYLDPKNMFDAQGALLPIAEIPEDLRRAIASFEVVETFEWEGEGPNRRKVFSGYLKKVKLWSKDSMLTLSARHLGILHDNVSVKVDSVVDALHAAEQRAKQAE
jgi:phage terminase small subunit